MSLILIVSIAIRLVAMGWSIVLLRRIRDWRMGFLTVMLGLMALRQALTLLTENESWTFFIAGHLKELPGLIVSTMAFLTVFYLERIVSERKRAEKVLQESEARYRSLTNDVLDSSAVGIFILDSDFKVIWVNQALGRYFGLRRDEIIGKDKRQLIRERIMDIFKDPEDFAEKVLATYDNNTYSENFECHVLPKTEREERWLEHWSQPIQSGLYAGGRIEHYYDITDRKRAEQHIQHLQSVLQEIRNVNQLIVHEKNQNRLLQRVCEILTQTKNYKLVWIGLIEEGMKNVLPVAQVGFEEGYLKSIKITWNDSETGKGPTGTAIKTKKPSVMRNIAVDPEHKPWRKEAMKHGYVSSAALPLVYKDRVFGALNVYASNPDSFDEEEIELLFELSRDIAFALHNIELEKKHKRIEKELQVRREENIKLAVIAKERGELQDWINTFDTFVGKYDPKGIGIIFNDTPLKAGGVSMEEVVGKYFPDTKWWSHSEIERAKIVECFERAKESLPSRIETSFRSADGTPVPIIFNCQPVIDDQGKVKYITAEGKTIIEETELRNALQQAKEALEIRVRERTSELLAANKKMKSEIAERKRVEKALRENEEKFRHLSEEIVEGITVTFDGKNRWVNKAFCEIFGYSQTELIGQGVDFLIVPEEVPLLKAQMKDRIAGKDVPSRYETVAIRKDGKRINIEVSAKLITFAGEQAIQIVIRDITERKRAEEALRTAHDELELKVAERTRELAQANIQLREIDRLKSEFLATMSHELRTPLNSIIGFTGIILNGISGKINAEQNKQLAMVYSSAKHLLSLINDILDLSRIESGKMEIFPEKFKMEAVVSEVAQILNPLIAPKELELFVETPSEEITEIYSDRKKVFQILLNLANNAVKFTDKGEIKIKYKRENDKLKVSVSDTGPGIKKENLDYLFEAFRQIDGRAQRRYQGAGLGLYLCKKLVKLLGGEIWVKSVYGQGSEFTFTLPRSLKKGK